MSLVINTNLISLNTQRNLAANQGSLSNAMQRLSSGLRVNSAKDDAAGLAISTGLVSQTNGLSVAIRNANDGVSLAQTADGALGNINDNLQRLRQLALESSNGTNSNQNRAALNTEAQQLIQEIKRVTSVTNFNGVHLLDGTFTGTSFQIGANAGEQVGINIGNVTPGSLGGGITTSVSASGSASALANGDLILNGVVIGPSLASQDSSTLSTASPASSAIAKVAAINKLTTQTGVTANVLTNEATGQAMANATNDNGTITLNGISIGLAYSTSLSTASNRAAAVSSINNYTGQTGIIAVDTGSDSTGIRLTAADGRNIAVGNFVTGGAGTATNVSWGLPVGAASPGQIYYGGYTLTGVNGASVTVQQGTGNLTNSGLNSGTYQAGTAIIASSSPNTTAMSAGDVVINGVTIGASLTTDDTLSTNNKSGSAIAKAAAINRVTSSTGVTASVNTNTVNGTSMTGPAAQSGAITINGVATNTVTILATNTTADVRTMVVNAVNAISGQTGVTAVDTSDPTKGVQLVAKDGRNVTLALGGTLTSANTGLATASTYASTISLSSAKAIRVDAGSGTIANSGLTVGTWGNAQNGQFVSNIDISTFQGAQNAIGAIDNALQQINTVRAQLGAIENRFSSTISNLQITNENLTASNSRIVDADFAAETANMSRAQVIQQAGISILSQANALNQQVLNLLR